MRIQATDTSALVRTRGSFKGTAFFMIKEPLGEVTRETNLKSHNGGSSGQDGGTDKCGLPPLTPIARLQLNYRTNITQNCQKIELYGDN